MKSLVTEPNEKMRTLDIRPNRFNSSALSSSVDRVGQMHVMPHARRCLLELCELMTYCMCGSYLSY